MKRFWTRVACVPADRGSFLVLLDDKPLRLPGGGQLAVAGSRLAEAIAAEWRQAGSAPDGLVSRADLPLTGLAGTLQERIVPDPAPTVAALASYAANDLLCYRADHPALAARQQRLWQPWLDWAAATHGARLSVTVGVMPVVQPAESLRALNDAVAGLPLARLAGLSVAVPALGSLVLGLALVNCLLPAAAAHELSCLDELFQAEAWGEDDVSAARRRAIGAEVALAERFVSLSHER